MTLRLSVVIPVRNGRDFVSRAVASAQAIPAPVEIVVVDDGSSDGTLDVLQRLAEEDPRIVVVRRDADHGAAAARNAGIAAARGDVVCFLDADDELYPQPIADRFAWHQAHPDVALSFAKHESRLPGGAIEPCCVGYCPRFEKFVAGRSGLVDLGDAAFNLLFGENPVSTTGAMARRDALLAAGGFAADLRMSQDWDMWLRLAQHGRVAYSSNVEALYTVRAGSLSGDAHGRARYNGEVLRRHWGFAMRRSPAAAFAALSFVEVARAEMCRAEDHDGAAWAHYLAAFLASPSVRHARDFARASAVLLGLRSGRPETLEERARNVALNGRRAVAARVVRAGGRSLAGGFPFGHETVSP